MLQNLHVKDLALIQEIDVEFQDGLNILTGETGAGKSIILGSVNLALGGRFSKDMIREGAPYGLVELSFSVGEKEKKLLEEMDIYPEDGSILLSRRLMEGRSVSRINGETVTKSILKAVASILIDIHGQHEHQSLLYKKNHLSMVDAYGQDRIAYQKSLVRDAFHSFTEINKELEKENAQEKDREKELLFLRFETEEIENANLKLGEDEELEAAYKLMVNGKKIAESLAEAYAYTGEGNASASESLGRALRALQGSIEYDQKAKELYDQLAEVDALLSDFNHEMTSYTSSLEYSEEDCYETEKRLNEINHLKSKYGNTIEKILAYGQEKQERIALLEDYDHYIASLKAKLKEAEDKLEKASLKLSDLRKKEAVLFAKAVEERLWDLNFEEVKFEISFQKLERYTADGIDDVEFMISLNPGQPIRPLVNVASGGELSRVMLAIKTVMADKDAIETLIFDEIDVGISGRTAQKVSEQMSIIGRNHQVICITHLAQIAAMADAHYMIKKEAAAGSTRTNIYLLNQEESVEELARILGGAKITDAVIENAKEMRQLALQGKLNLKEKPV